MKIKGQFIGMNNFESKKGTDCFFATVATEFDQKREPNGIGYKIVNMSAFGADAVSLYKKCFQEKLVDTVVECTGMFAGDSFRVLDIQAAEE